MPKSAAKELGEEALSNAAGGIPILDPRALMKSAGRNVPPSSLSRSKTLTQTPSVRTREKLPIDEFDDSEIYLGASNSRTKQPIAESRGSSGQNQTKADADVGSPGKTVENADNAPVGKTADSAEAPARTAGETTATATGKQVHKQMADARRASGDFDLVQQAVKDKDGNPILVSKSVNLKTGQPQPGVKLQEATPDAVSFSRKHIVDDKPLGRPIAKDRQEIIRFINAYKKREGELPKVIAIQRYDPQTGQAVLTELYSPSDFLPR